MNGNDEKDIEAQDNFNDFMVKKKLFLRDITGQVSMSPDKVMIGKGDAAYEYTMAMGIADYKKSK